MKILCLETFYYVDHEGLKTLQKRMCYIVPDYWGRILCKEGLASEYIKIKGVNT